MTALARPWFYGAMFRTSALIAVLLALSGVASAQQPSGPARLETSYGFGAPYSTSIETPSAAFQVAFGGTLVRWQGDLSISLPGDATAALLVCFSMAPVDELTLTEATGVITDTQGPDGVAGCDIILPGMSKAIRLDRSNFDHPNAVLRRTGACFDVSENTWTNPTLPCGKDADCPGADTCTANSYSYIQGAYVIYRTVAFTGNQVGFTLSR